MPIPAPVAAGPRVRIGDRLSRRWATVFLGLIAILVAPAEALAHGALKSSAPKAGASLDTVPTELRLLFNERVELRLSKIVLFGPDGAAVPIPTVRFGDANKALLVTGPLMKLAPGRYEVRWQVAGADGHPTRGSFTFAIRDGAVRVTGDDVMVRPAVDDPGRAELVASTAATPGIQPAPPVSNRANGFDERSVPYILIRWLQYAAVFLMVGTVVFSRVVLPRALEPGEPQTVLGVLAREGSLRIGTLASGALLALQAARFLAQRETLRGSGDFRLDVTAADMLLGSAWGTGLLLVVLGALLTLAVLRRMSVVEKGATPLLILGLGIAAIGLGLSGHQAASPIGAPLAVLLDAVHVLGTAGWLGTLAVLVMSALPVIQSEEASDHAQVARILRAFSPVALISAAVAGATGVTLAAVNLGRVPALWESEYGRVLLIKLSVLAFVVATGAYNWRRVLPSLGTAQSTLALRRSATAEVLVAIAVVAVSAVLVATPNASMP